MKTLYLATYRLRCSPYMEDSYYEDGTRLVWGRTTDEAEYLLKQEVEVSHSYCLDKRIEDLTMTEAIGEPIDA